MKKRNWPRGACDADAAVDWGLADDIVRLGLPQREAELLIDELRADGERRRFALTYLRDLAASRGRVGDVAAAMGDAEEGIEGVHSRIDRAGVIVAGILRRIGGGA